MDGETGGEMDEKERSGWCGKRERREKRRGRSRTEYEGSSKREEVGRTEDQKIGRRCEETGKESEEGRKNKRGERKKRRKGGQGK